MGTRLLQSLRIRLSDKIEILLSFILPVLIMGSVYMSSGIYPAGEKTVLICDMYGQYVDYHAAFHDILTQGKSLLYSWEAGMGLNFLGLYAYYLSSPFSFLILFFSRQNLTEALLLITLLKLGACGLTFAVLLKYLGTKYNGTAVLFSVLYALMSYSIVYSFNIMWLDGVILLPLVILGVEKILRENRSLFFLISLIILFISNFYIGYMVGLFSLLYFLVRFFTDHTRKEYSLLIRKSLLFFSGTILAAGCAAFLWLPAFFILFFGQEGPDISALSWHINYNPLALFSKLQLGAYDTLSLKGLPNIFCGYLPLLLTPVFFLSKKIASREKILYFSFFLFLLISFNFSPLDLAWHGFDKPNSFPYRYSFLFSFLMLILSFRVLNMLASEDIPKVLRAGSGYLKGMKVMIMLLVVLVSVESGINTWYLVKGLDQEYVYKTKDIYRAKLAPLETLVKQIKDKDDSFYRMDRIGGRSFNDPLHLDYKGITHFSSMSDSRLHYFLRQLGFLSTAEYKSVNFAGSTPVTESLLGIKYVISAREKGIGYEMIMTEGNFQAYQNRHVLPLGFMVSKQILSLDITQNNPFRLQNDLINLSQGTDSGEVGYLNIFKPLSLQKADYNNMVVVLEDDQEICIKEDDGEEGWVEYTMVIPQAQQVYACFDSSGVSPQVFLNGQNIGGYLPIYNKRIIDLGYHLENTVLKLKILSEDGELSIRDKYFYGLDENTLKAALHPLGDESLEIKDFDGTHIKGIVRASANGFLFTSIPYDPGWKVWVDGQEISITKIGDALTAVELTEGEHILEFRFSPSGLRPGLVISGISLITVILLFLLTFSRSKCH